MKSKHYRSSRNTHPTPKWFPVDLSNSPALDTAYWSLLARGFLVEKISDYIRLSDNACCYKRPSRKLDDPAFFEATIQNLKLGEIDAEGRFTPTKQWNQAQIIQLLFPAKHYQSETPVYDWHGNWSKFTPLTGNKIPLSILDSRIAGLIKALSSVGCRTTICCHGTSERNSRFSRTNHFIGKTGLTTSISPNQIYQPAYIQFSSNNHLAWFHTIVELLSSKYTPKYQLIEDYNLLSFHPRQGDSLEDVWSSLISLGLEIYQQRIHLRAYKSTILDLCKQLSITHFPSASQLQQLSTQWEE